MNYKIKSTGAIIIADLAFVAAHYAGDFTEVLDVHVVTDPTYKSWLAFDFYRKFTSVERIAIREFAKTDPVAEDFYATLNAAIASGANVRDDDVDTRNGLAYLESIGAIKAGRALELLA